MYRLAASQKLVKHNLETTALGIHVCTASAPAESRVAIQVQCGDLKQFNKNQKTNKEGKLRKLNKFHQKVYGPATNIGR